MKDHFKTSELCTSLPFVGLTLVVSLGCVFLSLTDKRTLCVPFSPRGPDAAFDEIELFGVTNLVEHPAQMSPPGKLLQIA